MLIRLRYASFLIVVAFLLSCRENVPIRPKKKMSSVENVPLNQPGALMTDVTYSLTDSFPDKAAVDSFFMSYKPEDLNVLLALNRIDKKEVRKGTSLVIPSMIFPDFAHYITLPANLEETDTIPKFILVSLRNQCFGIYENGHMIKCGPVSTGRKAAPTPAGKYHTNWKKKVKVSTIDHKWIMPWYFNIENRKGIAFHKYILPGYPASHACIRLRKDDAEWIFNWADQWVLEDQGRKVLKNGTPVVIFGSYDFDAEPVWKLLPQDKKAMDLTNEEMSEIRELLQQPGVNKVEAPEIGVP